MNKKVIIINGSPRKNGNTVGLIEAFTKGAAETGNTVVRFDLQQMDIHPCLGCLGGGKNPKSPCVQKDDMDKIYPIYKDADVVVLASPLYYWNISGQLKCAFDRLFAVAECNPGFENPQKECVLLMAAEGNGFEETTYWYDNLMKHLNWKSLGTVLAEGVMEAGDIKNHPALRKAHELGASI